MPKLRLENFTRFNSLLDVLKAVPNFLIIIGIILFAASIITAGFLYLTAGGNEQSAAKAREALLAAGIGIIILSAGELISYYLTSYLYY